MGGHCYFDCITHCMGCHEKMARKLCVQNRFELVDFCPGWLAGIGNCIIDGELAKLESSYKEPCESVEV